ncbi:MAG: hypothetical protein JSS51_07885 [Planctomycetes bacterium]|nr:hypothetical protein [Planctomycetota bacterium]
MDIARPEPKPGMTVARLQRLAKAFRAAVRSDVAADFLNATSALPWIQPRRLYQDPESKDLFPSSAIAAIPSEKRWKLVSRAFHEHDYYEGRYGTPLTYATFLDALADHGVATVSGKRVLDIGYASILPLRLMACLGADITGLESDRLPHALYSFEGDSGEVRTVRGRTIDRTHNGRLRLVRGRLGVDWTPDPESFDLILSRNTLKQGYVHPRTEHALEPNVRLKLSDAEFLAVVRRSLAPGGVFAIYNTFDPADTGPGGDGRCPFSQEQFASAQLRTVVIDSPDDQRSLALFTAAESARNDLAGPLGKLPPRALLTVVRAV